jgi:hypothetical protein
MVIQKAACWALQMALCAAAQWEFAMELRKAERKAVWKVDYLDAAKVDELESSSVGKLAA